MLRAWLLRACLHAAVGRGLVWVRARRRSCAVVSPGEVFYPCPSSCSVCESRVAFSSRRARRLAGRAERRINMSGASACQAVPPASHWPSHEPRLLPPSPLSPRPFVILFDGSAGSSWFADSLDRHPSVFMYIIITRARAHNPASNTRARACASFHPPHTHTRTRTHTSHLDEEHAWSTSTP